ncbi:MAG: hypothetical protein IGQ45_01455 [Cyanobacterium sp. T60_A2020_053]|nr:hypothetical protein [Cyanobacterium sp. T60_A2020_053]
MKEYNKLFKKEITEDGSVTFYSEEFDENFHSKYGAKKESEITYIQGCKIVEKLQSKSSVKILDVCFGLGYNAASALEIYQKIKPSSHLEIIALEIDEDVIQQTINHNLLSFWSQETKEVLTFLAEHKTFINQSYSLQLIIDDARISLEKLVNQKYQFDAIFLDPFSPPKCPQLWTVEFFGLLSKCLANDGIIATYSCAAAVRKAMQLNGLNIASNEAVGGRAPGTIASFYPLPPLSLKELEQLETKASVPYRDTDLRGRAPSILKQRENEQKNSSLESTGKWKKRWSKSNKVY